MSTYRTISLTDMASISTSVEPDLKFLIKSYELERASANCTPKAFDLAAIDLKNDYLPSEGSILDDEHMDELIVPLPWKGDELEAKLDRESSDVVVYGETEVLDFEPLRYQRKASIPKRPRFDSKLPLLVDEMKARAPELFIRNILLDDYFSVEQSFAANLKTCYASICPDERYSADLFMKPLDFGVFLANRDGSIELHLQRVEDAFGALELSCAHLNDTIRLEYERTKLYLKWEIFSNSCSNKNFENGRSMFEALIKFKGTFQRFIHEGDLWMEMDACVNEMSDAIVEWNEKLDGCTHPVDNTELVKKHSELDLAAYIMLANSMKYIELSLRENSAFIANNCRCFADIIDEVKLLYDDFLNHFKSSKDKNGVFTYEICLFDDHIKEKIRQNSCP